VLNALLVLNDRGAQADDWVLCMTLLGLCLKVRILALVA